MSNALIRVADAASFDAPPTGRRIDEMPQVASDTATRRMVSRSIFAVLLAWTLIHFTQFGFIDGTERWNIVLVVMRYLLWPAIALAFMFHVLTAGGGASSRVLRAFAPFLMIGIVSSLLGYSPATSLRLVFFWTLGVMAAVAIGLEVRRETLWTTLFWTFFAFVAASILCVIVNPKLGIMRDTRVESGGAWRGLFPGKNLTGLICIYAFIMAWFAVGAGRFWRLACAGATGVLMVFAASQGAIVTGILAVEYVVLVGMLRRSRLSPGMQAAVLALATIGTVLAFTFGASFLLGLVGRDTSLSGRTDIWSAYLKRATYFWLHGAGPGSFSLSDSPVTADLSHAFLGFGEIHSPHNMFIAAFGELGIFGMLALAVPLLYFAFGLPCLNRGRAALPAATVAFTMVAGGISETREVFGLGMNMFLLVLMIAAMQRERIEKAESAAEPAQTLDADRPVETWTGPRVLG